MIRFAGMVVVIVVGLALAALGQTAPNDYGDDKSWLCRPGRSDACHVDLTTTVIGGNGKLTREKWTSSPNAPIDCFYVYPTVSTDATPNSDMIADAAELNVIRQQFARFVSVRAPLPRRVADGMRYHIRVIPFDRAPACGYTFRQGRRSEYGCGVHEPGRAQRR